MSKIATFIFKPNYSRIQNSLHADAMLTFKHSVHKTKKGKGSYDRKQFKKFDREQFKEFN